MKRDQTAKGEIKNFNRAFHRLWFKIMKKRPEFNSDAFKRLSFTDLHVINMAYENPDIILKDIRENLMLPQTTLSSIVAKLEKAGLVERIVNPKDYRSFSLKVTAKGKKLITEHKKLDLLQSSKILECLEPAERHTFIRLLIKVADTVKP